MTAAPLLPHNSPVSLVLAKLPKAKKSGAGWLAPCPAHNDSKPSLSISEGTDGKCLLKCHAGCTTDAIVAALGLTESDLFPPKASARAAGGPSQIVATYDYHDESGNVRFQVVRMMPKDFRQRHRVGDDWIWNMKGVQRVLYHLPEILEAKAEERVIFLVEGEKDADNLRALGFAATTNPGGAKKWLPAYTDTLTGANVIIVPDNDRAGAEHQQLVCEKLHGFAATLRIMDVPAPHKDVSDWILKDRATAEDIKARALEARVYAPAPKPAVAEVVSISRDVLLLDPRDPLTIARRFIADRYQHPEGRRVHAWRGDLHIYTGSHFRTYEDAAARAEQYEYLEPAMRPSKDGRTRFQPNPRIVSDVLDAIRAASHLNESVSPPVWLDARKEPAPSELISCANGLLHFPTRTLFPSSPALFTTHALPFDYDADVGEPVEWLAFLRSLWPEDEAAIDALQEIFGYIVSGDLRQQKMFLLVGPKRAGKDTIARILRTLVGVDACAGPTLSSLAGPFGLEPMIGKSLAVVSDARLSGRADQAVIAERLLSITGEGALTIDRKHRGSWTGRLPTRFMILTNEMPRLEDASGALASRFIVLTLSRSWYGREDVTLCERLEAELPAILTWALDGLDRLWDRGSFTVPKSSIEAVQELEDLGSPVKHFVRECAELDPMAETPTDALYARWQRWCELHGRHAGAEATFGKQLRAAFSHIRTIQHRGDGERWRAYIGIKLPDRGLLEL